MATKIVTKNSSTASSVPTAAQLVQGELAVNVVDKRLFTEDNAGAIVELGTNPSSLTVSGNIDVDGTTNLDVVDIDGAVDMASTLTVTGEITANGGIALGDNDKATFGASDDLQIFHDSSNSYIIDNGIGSLFIRGNSQIQLQDTNTAGKFFVGAAGGSSTIYHNNNPKLATTSTGIDVTGTATMDGLTVEKENLSDLKTWSNSDLGSIDFYQAASYPSANNYGRVLDINSGSGNSNGGSTIRLLTAEGNFEGRQRLSIANNGDISFYEDTGTTPKLFWDASAESLGIGTSSPNSKFHISSSGTSASATIFNSGNTADITTYTARAGLQFIAYQSDGGFPYTKTSAIIANADGTAPSELQLWTKANGSSSAVERMRIDSLGNASFNTTSTSPSANNVFGTALLQYGGASMSRTNSTTLDLNRSTSNGAIIQFRKDGDPVGSIGTSATANFNITSRQTGHGGIEFGTHNIMPMLDGILDDDATDLGSDNYRWKNLYLSGGVYLGGTGAANKLDDYEEGVWTPVYSPQTGSFTTLAMDTPSASYTKIGNTVILRAFIRTDDVDITGASGALRIAGLPFSVNKYQAVATSYALGGNWTNSISSGYADTGGFIALLKAGELTATPQDMISGTNANKNSLMLEVSYETTV